LANPPNSWKPVFPDTPLLIGGDYQLTASSQVLADPLLIFHFILVSISRDGNPARVISELLKGFMLADSFVYKEVVFDLATDKQTLEYTNAIIGLVKSLERCAGFYLFISLLIVYQAWFHTCGDSHYEPLSR
jgi:hypothetical protein